MRGDRVENGGAGRADARSRAAAWAAVAALAFGLWLAFGAIDAWAGLTFARPALGSALVAAIDLVLLAIAFAAAPLVSRLFETVIRAAVK